MFAFRTIKILNLSKNLINISEINRKSLPSIFIRRKNSSLNGKEIFNFEDEISNMRKFYPSVKNEILENIPLYMDKLKFEKFLDYNFHIVHRKGLFSCTIFLYRNLSPELFKKTPTNEEEYVLNILNEMWHLFAFIFDDMVDKSVLRFNYPTWHSFNDEYETIHYYFPAIYSAVCSFAAKNFEKYPYYKNLTALYHKSGCRICISFVIDYLFAKLQKNMDWMEFHRQLSYFKNAYFSEVAIKTILYMIGYEEIPQEKEYDQILAKIGFYLQSANDYFDHFGNFDKVGRNLDSDMKFGIITWPLAYVWNYGSEEQKKLIMEHYGRPEQESMNIISDIYKDFNFREKFEELEKRCQLEIHNDLKHISDENMRILALKATDVVIQYIKNNNKI